jgi:hypothetical protein
MSYTYRFNRINRDYDIDLFKTFIVLSNDFTTKEDIYNLVKAFPTISLRKLDAIYNLLEENNSVRIFYIPIIHQDTQLGYKNAHFLIQQDCEENGKYIFIDNIIHHIDEDLYSIIEEYFSNSNLQYYSTEQLLLMIDNQYITLFCDIFDNDNYYNDSYNPYFENQNHNFLHYEEENEIITDNNNNEIF